MNILDKLVSKYIFLGERPSVRDATGINIARYMFALKYIEHKKVLEFGCSVGYGAHYLMKGCPARISAYDGDKGAIAYARKNFANEKITYTCKDIEQIKLEDKFDVTISYEIIEHLLKPDVLLDLAKNSLKKNGFFLVSTINRAYSAYDNGRPSNPYHVKEYFAGEFEILLKRYFSSVSLYGIILKNKNIDKSEQNMRSTAKWRLASELVRHRIVRKLLHYFPEGPKRLFTGESKLIFEPQDFQLSAERAEKTQYLYAVCKP